MAQSTQVEVLGTVEAEDGKADITFRQSEEQTQLDISIRKAGDVHVCVEQSDGSLKCWKIVEKAT